jgi:glycosyltransferase involved in cell wall biosynthesis
MRILIDAAGNWTPATLRGGSEECVCGLSAALAARGHEVAVCNGCGDAQGDYDGVQFLDGEPQENDDPALVIAWRDWPKVPLNRRRFPGATVVLWCHDIPVPPHWPDSEAMREVVNRDADAVVLLNEHHRGRYLAAGLRPEKAAVIRIGVDQAPYRALACEGTPRREMYRCGFFSHPGRGLHRLRDEFWPKIKAAVPDATLAAFWWEPEHFLPPNEALGILPMRALRQEEVAREMSRCALLTYASVFSPECSPAVCIHALLAGAVPVVVPEGGMRDVLGGHGHCATMETFAGAVVNALRDQGWQEKQRVAGRAWARVVYEWHRAAAEFEALAA